MGGYSIGVGGGSTTFPTPLSGGHHRADTGLYTGLASSLDRTIGEASSLDRAVGEASNAYRAIRRGQ